MSCFVISMYNMMIYTHLDALFLYFYVHHDDLYTPGQCPVSLFLCTPEYANYFYDTSVIFSNFIITYRESITGPS